MSNAGQYRHDVAYAALLPTHQDFVLRDGRMLHSLPMRRNGISGAWVIVEKLAGASLPQAVPGGSAFVEDSVQVLDWRDAWPGVDMRLQIVDGRTERIFRVAPGASPAKIALAFDGVRFMPAASGGLTGQAGNGLVSLSAPIAYQETVHGRVAINVEYVLRRNGALVTFRLGEYDHSLPLTIDPVLQSTYLSYGAQGVVTSMVVDPTTGDLIAAGMVSSGAPGLSIGVPGAAGGFQSIANSSMAFIARIDAKLRRVIQATYFADTYPTFVARVAVHPLTGEIYVTGDTQVPDFPGGGGGANPELGGSRHDGFVTRFSSDLRQLLQTTFTGQDLQYVLARDMAINATTGDVYVVGNSVSAAVILRFNGDLTQQLGRFIIQGNSFDYGASIAINQSSGDAYASVYTSSTELPGTAGGAEPSVASAGPFGYVARLDAGLNQIIQATYVSELEPGPLPHTGSRYTPLITLNPVSGDLYVAGWASSDHPAAIGGAIPAFLGGNTDVMVMRLTPDLRQVGSSTYFGGSGFEEIGDLAVTPDGAHLYITGFTFSLDLAGAAGGAIPTSTNGGAFVARLSSSLATLDQSTYFTSSGNTDGYAVAVHPTTGEVYLGGQSIEGISGLEGGAQPYYDSIDHSFGSAFVARFDGLLSGGADTIADAFSFADQYGVEPGAVAISAPVRIEGITVPVAATVTNGEFSIDGGPFSAMSRQVVRGQSIRVRHTSALGTGATTNTVLNVGSVSDLFTSTTASGADSTPTDFSFPERNPVAMNILVESAAVTVSGINAAAPVSIVNGEYSIDGGAFTSAAGTVNGGQSVVIRHRSATVPATLTQSQLTIGGVSHAFNTTTDPVDASVHPFQFRDVLNVTPGIDVTADPIVVMGINVPVPVSVVGGEWSTDGINYTSSPGTVTNLQPISLRAHTGSGHTTMTVTLTVGDQSGDWVLRQPQLGDTTPDPFSFSDIGDAPILTFILSNQITVTGIDVPVWVNLMSGEYLDPVLGMWRNQGYLSNGATTRLRVFTTSNSGETAIVRGQIGSVDVLWQVQTVGGDSVPDPFDFLDRTGVTVSSLITSDAVILSGLIGDTPLALRGCEASVNSGPYSSATVRVRNGDTVDVRLMSASTASTTTSCTIDIGGVRDTFSVTTAAASGSGGGGGSSGGGSSSGGTSPGGGGGSFDWVTLLLLLTLLVRSFQSPTTAPGYLRGSVSPRAG